MKVFALLMMFVGFGAQAAEFPELYCVSTKAFSNVNQINVFTNKKGTLRISLQFYAVSDDGADAGNFDTKVLQTVTRLSFNEQSGLMSNNANKVQFQVSPSAITPAQAQALLAASAKPGFDLENMTGSKIDFKQYYTAKMVAYNLPGEKDMWTETLAKAYEAGVTDYVCGNIKDEKGARPSIFGSDQSGD